MIESLSVESKHGIGDAWGRAFLDLMKPGLSSRHPAVVTMNMLEKLDDVENGGIRKLLDSHLTKLEQKTCGTVASTIFPMSFWKPKAADDDEALFARYDRAWPKIALCPQNRKGVYFRRLIAYAAKGHDGAPVNQLQTIIASYKKGMHRKSALQAAIFDPSRDHTNEPYGSFPCLQHVTFTPLENGKLSIAGFYARQLHFEKAYGNYLGLLNLGKFMAKHFELELSQVVCVASFLDLSEKSKKDLMPLAEELKKIL